MVNNNNKIISKIKWSAPELLKEHKYSFKSDIWSFGIVCIEILTRNDPFPQMKSIDVMKIKKNKKILLSAVNEMKSL